jgi:catechol 2,3-dioxygenase-like lactoylglutathione lyase family enzyme
MDIVLDSIQIFVSDIEKAKKWYSEIIGMKLIDEYSKLKILHMKLGKTDFYIETPNPKWGEGWDTVKIGGRTPIIFVTKNIEKTVKYLKQKKVKIIEKTSKRPWGQYKAVFADVDDNEFNLVEQE